MNGKITEEIPYGFMRHEKYDVVVMDSEKMESVKLMFSLCLDGMSLGQIKNVIESQGIEYPAKYKKDKIVGWSLAEIRKILPDPRKEMGDIEVLCCKDSTREIVIRYLKYVSVYCAGNIEIILNT